MVRIKPKDYKKITVYGGAILTLAVIVSYIIYSNSIDKVDLSQNNIQNDITNEQAIVPNDNIEQQKNIVTNKQDIQTDNSENTKTESKQTEVNSNQTKTTSPTKTEIDGIKILKSSVTSTAKFYPYQLGNTYMEVLAVKATDGSIRTALNTCQVCYDSGRGYYKQEGDYLVCQNCGNRFYIDQVELIKGGCNPVPILEESKKDIGDSIVIPKDYLETQKEYFSRWKR